MNTLTYQGKTIKARADGRYWVRYRDVDGAQRSLYGKTAEEVKKKLVNELKIDNARRKERDEARAEAKRKADDQKRRLYLYSWLDYWNETFKKPFNKTDNISGYIRNHIKSRIEDKPLANVTTFELQELINSIPGNGKMRKEVQDVLNGAFRVAFNNRLIEDNPTLRLVKPRYECTKGKAMTYEEQAEVLRCIANDKMRDLWLIYIMTGARRSELLRVTPNDIDFDKAMLHLPGTKTKRADRRVAVSNVALELLRRASVGKLNDEILWKWSPSWVTHHFVTLTAGHNIKELRHTFGTRSSEVDVNIKALQLFMGHSSYKTTADIYVDVFTPTMQREAKKVNDYFDEVFKPYLEEDLDTQFDTQNNEK